MERDFTYIDDVVAAVAGLVDHPPAGDPAFDRQAPDPATSAAPHRILNIGKNQPVSLTRFIKTIGDALGRPVEQRFLPMQPGDVRTTFASTDDLARLVGFVPSTSIEEGVGRFVDWYRGFYGA